MKGARIAMADMSEDKRRITKLVKRWQREADQINRDFPLAEYGGYDFRDGYQGRIEPQIDVDGSETRTEGVVLRRPDLDEHCLSD